MHRAFIPANKPKSWVVFICACLMGLLVFGPIAAAGSIWGLSALYAIGYAGFIVTWCVGAASFIVFALGLVSGKYRELSPRSWRDQVW